MGKIPREVPTVILLEVYNGGKLTMSQLQKRTGMSTITVLEHVNAMVDAGLLIEEREVSFPRRRMLTVSGEGRQVSSLLTIAGETEATSQDLIDMGSIVGMVSAYKEAVELIRGTSFSNERGTAELLLRDLRALSLGMRLLSKAMPGSCASKAEQLNKIVTRIEETEREGGRRLIVSDIKGAMKMASNGFAAYNESFPLMVEIHKYFRERGLGELASLVDSLSPKKIQKE